MSVDIFDELVHEPKDKRNRVAPSGWYNCDIVEVKRIKNPSSGNTGYEVRLAPVKPLNGQDLEGVNLSRTFFKHAHWLTQNTREMQSSFLAEVHPDFKPDAGKFADWFDSLVGLNVNVNVELSTEKWDGTPRKYPEHMVKSYRAST